MKKNLRSDLLKKKLVVEESLIDQKYTNGNSSSFSPITFLTEWVTAVNEGRIWKNFEES